MKSPLRNSLAACAAALAMTLLSALAPSASAEVFTEEEKKEITALMKTIMASVMTEVKAAHQEGVLDKDNTKKIVQSHLSPQVDFHSLARTLMGSRRYKKFFNGKEVSEAAYIDAIRLKIEGIFAAVFMELENPQSIDPNASRVTFSVQHTVHMLIDETTIILSLKQNDDGKWLVRNFRFVVGGTPVNPLPVLGKRVRGAVKKHPDDPGKMVESFLAPRTLS